MAARGVKQLEVGRNAIITDFARETAELLNIELVQPGAQVQQQPRPAGPAAPQNVSQGRYNKPRGCQHGPLNHSVSFSGTAVQPLRSQESDGTSSVNALVDIVGKIMKRGG